MVAILEQDPDDLTDPVIPDSIVDMPKDDDTVPSEGGEPIVEDEPDDGDAEIEEESEDDLGSSVEE